VEAAARALASSSATDDVIRRAEVAVHAADAAVYGVVPREEYEQLALDYSAMKVRALQDEDLLELALETLDSIAAESLESKARDLAFATAAEVRAMLRARSDDDPEL
jgi:hypothetical protein